MSSSCTLSCFSSILSSSYAFYYDRIDIFCFSYSFSFLIRSINWEFPIGLSERLVSFSLHYLRSKASSDSEPILLKNSLSAKLMELEIGLGCWGSFESIAERSSLRLMAFRCIFLRMARKLASILCQYSTEGISVSPSMRICKMLLTLFPSVSFSFSASSSRKWTSSLLLYSSSSKFSSSLTGKGS